jgi:uncharacterized protein (TIGR00375 family)
VPRLAVDLHLHSRFSMGTSPALDLSVLVDGARRTGVSLIAAPDFTHPVWLDEMLSGLEEAGDGVYRLRVAGELSTRPRQGSLPDSGPPVSAEQPEYRALLMFATEVSCVWEQAGRGRRVHLLLFAPDAGAVQKLNRALRRLTDLSADGRPTLTISPRHLAETAWHADDRFVLIPAHAWTPWYGIYGSKSGFDSMEECFGDLAPRIFAIETGLSSDPAMNWRVSDVDGRAIVSFSDAHSPPAMGREATVLDCQPDFPAVVAAIKDGRIVETLEFHPDHGKYHLDGHRRCGVKLSPKESAASRGRCPNCGRKLTIGVLNRIEQLASRPESVASPLGGDGLVRGPAGRPPFRYLVPLRDVLSQALGTGPSSRKVALAYDRLTAEMGGELNVLTAGSARDIGRIAGDRAAAAVLAARQGMVEIDPGYDGEYGTVRVRFEQAVTPG